MAGKSTLKDQSSPLKSRISKGFDTLRSNNQLLLPQRKLKAIIDIGSTAPQVFSESFKNKEHIKKYWVKPGYFDSDTYTCPDIHQLMNTFHINWSEEKRKLFLMLFQMF